MSIETDARQEAERRWPALNPGDVELTYPREALRATARKAFEAGAVWAREKDTRELSEDPCPEWKCPDLSSEDRREGKTCPDHPCTCTRAPSDDEVEAGCVAFYEGARGITSWERLKAADPDLANRYRDGIRAALLAAQEARRG